MLDNVLRVDRVCGTDAAHRYPHPDQRQQSWARVHRIDADPDHDEAGAQRLAEA
jgi:hypothetical protein